MSRHNGLPGYDEWKLRTPEDDAYRGRYRPTCRICGEEGHRWQRCSEGAEPCERDPDDARDDMQDREMNR
jgi:hypothetical protein